MSRLTRDKAIQLKAKFASANLMRSRSQSLIFFEKKIKRLSTRKTQKLITDVAINSRRSIIINSVASFKSGSGIIQRRFLNPFGSRF